VIRRVAAEFFGTFLLLCVVVGSGIAAGHLSPDPGVQVLINAVSIGLGLASLIWWLGPVSGAHFNPVITGLAVAEKRIPLREASSFVAAQLLGAVAGTFATNWMFGRSVVEVSTQVRTTPGTFVSEIFATALLVAIVSAIVRRGDSKAAPAVIGAFITSAIFFTSSTIFANPAVTLGRIFTDSLTGIDPVSAVGFVLAEFIGLPVGFVIARLVRS
jgi:glycerol uptake facilitator-like aquaporin